MTAKEKAKELVDKMSSQTYSYQPYAGAYYNEEEVGWEAGKKCALIAVDQILNECFDRFLFSKCDYWQEVKQEIEKL
jgi:hypothetical protein